MLPALFVLGYLSDKGSTFCLGLVSDHEPATYPFHVAEITPPMTSLLVEMGASHMLFA
jgi:hypothetical protein